MKRTLALGMAIAVCMTAAHGQMVLYEDFESYPLGDSIHLRGTDVAQPWGEVPRWYGQANTMMLGDHWSSTVVSMGVVDDVDGMGWGTPVYFALKMVGRGTNGDPGTVATAMSMESLQINGQGTIYLRFASDGVGANTLATNDLEPGWDYWGSAAEDPGTINALGWQGNLSREGYAQMGALCTIGGGIPFRAWGGSGYVEDPAIQLPTRRWMELWIQIDHENDRTRYFICEQGGVPVQAMNNGSEWWPMRNDGRDNNAVQNLKFFVGAPGPDVAPSIYIDTIGVNTSAMTLERVGGDLPYPSSLRSDYNGDGVVDLDDFVILKRLFVSGEGDLDDFVIMKQEWGMCAWDEPWP